MPENRKKGRPRSDRAAQRDAIFTAATELMVKSGYQKTTMLAVATACGMSKQTLYSHFPSKKDLFRALLEMRAAGMNQNLDDALSSETLFIDQGLKQFSIDVLTIVTSEVSLAINRAAISSAAAGDPGMSRAYDEYARKPTYQRVLAMLERAKKDGTITFEDSDSALQDFIGLLVGDRQLRRLLGVVPAPTPDELEDRAARAVKQFLKLYGV